MKTLEARREHSRLHLEEVTLADVLVLRCLLGGVELLAVALELGDVQARLEVAQVLDEQIGEVCHLFLARLDVLLEVAEAERPGVENAGRLLELLARVGDLLLHLAQATHQGDLLLRDLRALVGQFLERILETPLHVACGVAEGAGWCCGSWCGCARCRRLGIGRGGERNGRSGRCDEN